ncbi:MAG: hypothetical protein EHM42_01370 [Planctomycetaceae bacterium]|nr:MAG: hypothetical protein EHM42_01370 [Planctomycetaceae bacterium]
MVVRVVVAASAAFVVLLLMGGLTLVLYLNSGRPTRRPGNPGPNRPDPFSGKHTQAADMAAELRRLVDPVAIPLPQFPPLETPRESLLGDAVVYDVDLRTANPSTSAPASGMRLRISLPAGEHPAASLGCVLLPPPGGSAISGHELYDEGALTHVAAYLQAGYAVVEFSLDGALSTEQEVTMAQVQAAFNAVRESRAGLCNCRAALEFVLARLPAVNPARLFISGHSSAGGVALLFAAFEPRLKGCIALAPVTDWTDDVPGELLVQMPGLREFSYAESAGLQRERPKCPVFIYHGTADENVASVGTEVYVLSVRALGQSVTFERGIGGDHFEAVNTEGVPRAIAWLKSLPGE